LRYKPLSTNTDPNLVTLELTRTFNIRWQINKNWFINLYLNK
jgi:hypothetical protein